LSARDPADREDTDGTGDNFLSRWSRRKAQSRAETVVVEPAPVEPAAPAPAPVAPVASVPEVAPADQAATGHAPAGQTPQAPAVELPDLDLLGEDSDYSAFLTPGVDADLRKRALRKLFSSPKFNVFDGLDTYRDDYTSFPALGPVVTADMRYHVERLAKKVVEVIDEQTRPDATAEPIAPAIIAPEAAALADQTAPAALEGPADPGTPAPAGQPALAPEENHDRIA
jgi:hypothetical protein